MNGPDPEPSRDPRWAGLFLAGGIGALATAALLPLQIAVFIAWPPPMDGSVVDWFATFRSNPLHGLVSLDVFMMIEQVLAVGIVAALYVVLRRASESLTLLGTVLWIVGATLFIASNTAFQMLALSNGYAAATSDADRAAIVAAGQAMLTTYWDMGTGFVFGYVLTSVGGILIGCAMARARLFGRFEAWALVVANVVGLGLFVPGIGVGISLISVLILEVWYVAIARRLFALGQARQDATESDPFRRPAAAREYGHV